MIGTELKRTYRVVETLGQGGMGTLYVAEHLKLPRRFAVKFLARLELATPELLKRFEREALITSGLGHPNIVEVIDFDHLEDGTPYIVMELLEGEDLGSRLQRRGALSKAALAPVARQICAALAAAHAAEIVHRDLKPQNIFLHSWGGAEVVKVLDFGISKIRRGDTQLTADRAVMGTAHYMAPEQAHGAASADARADLFALGTILYECLTGKLAFPGSTLAEVVHAVCYGPRPSLREARPDLPAALDRLVARLLAVEPSARYAAVQEVWDALAPALGGEASSLTDTSPPDAALPSTRDGSEATAATVASTPDGSEATAATVASTPDGSEALAATAASTPHEPEATASAPGAREASDSVHLPQTGPVRRPPGRRWPVPWWLVVGMGVAVVALGWRLERGGDDHEDRRRARRERRLKQQQTKKPPRERSAHPAVRRGAAAPKSVRVALAPPACKPGQTNLISLIVEGLGQTPGLLVPQDEVDTAWKAIVAAGGTRAGMERTLGRRLGAPLVVVTRCAAKGLHIHVLRISDGVVLKKTRAPLKLDRPARRQVSTLIYVERLKLVVRQETRSEEAAKQFIRALTSRRGGYNATNFSVSVGAFREAHRADPAWSRACNALAQALIYGYESSFDPALLDEIDRILVPQWKKTGAAKLRAGLFLGINYLQQEKLPQATPIIDYLVAKAGQSAGVATVRWLYLLAVGRYATAEEVIRAAARQVPQSATLRQSLASTRYQRGRFALALQEMAQPIRTQDRQFKLRERDADLMVGIHQIVGAHALRGFILLALNRSAEAIAEFEVELAQAKERSTFFNQHTNGLAWLGIAAARRRLGRAGVKQAEARGVAEMRSWLGLLKNPNPGLYRALEAVVGEFPGLALELLRKHRAPAKLGMGELRLLEAVALARLGRHAEAARVLKAMLEAQTGLSRQGLQKNYEQLLARLREADRLRQLPVRRGAQKRPAVMPPTAMRPAVMRPAVMRRRRGMRPATSARPR